MNLDNIKDDLKNQINLTIQEQLAPIREDLSTLNINTAILKNMLEANHKTSRESIERTNVLLEKHDVIIHGEKGDNGLKSKSVQIKAKLEGHITQDRWAYGIFTALILTMIGVILHH